MVLNPLNMSADFINLIVFATYNQPNELMRGINDWQAGINDSTVFHLFPPVNFLAHFRKIREIVGGQNKLQLKPQVS